MSYRRVSFLFFRNGAEIIVILIPLSHQPGKFKSKRSVGFTTLNNWLDILIFSRKSYDNQVYKKLKTACMKNNRLILLFENQVPKTNPH
jgi:hypothetical protein